MKATVKALANQKGGVGKTTTTESLGIGLAQHGKKVLLIDGDAQGSLSASMGYTRRDDFEVTLASQMEHIMRNQPFDFRDGILHHEEGVDLLPANIELASIELALVGLPMGRERILHKLVEQMRSQYDYILIDCQPSLGMMTVNALTAADSVIIPVQAEFLSTRGLQQLLSSIAQEKEYLNPRLQVDGVLFTMVNNRTVFGREMIEKVSKHYGANLRIFNQTIPFSVRAAESPATGKSIYQHDPDGKVAAAYKALTEEVLKHDKQRALRHADIAR